MRNSLGNSLLLVLALFLLGRIQGFAQVPGILNYQGKIAVGSVPFHGTGKFKFALVSADGATSYWSNDGSSLNGTEPKAAVSIAVTKGVYAVQLGDTSLANMSAKVSADVFNHPEVFLRIWFNDGVNGFQQLSPDKRVSSVAYALIAGGLDAGGIAAAQNAAQAGVDQAVKNAVSSSAKISAANEQLQKKVNDLASAIHDPKQGYLKQIADLQAQLQALKPASTNAVTK